MTLDEALEFKRQELRHFNSQLDLYGHDLTIGKITRDEYQRGTAIQLDGMIARCCDIFRLLSWEDQLAFYQTVGLDFRLEFFRILDDEQKTALRILQ